MCGLETVRSESEAAFRSVFAIWAKVKLPSALRKSLRRYTQDAEGSDCTLAEIFRRAKILKRFSCQTGLTLETISVN